MPAFEYTAIGPDGRKASGLVTADTARAARRELRLRQLTPLDVAESDGAEGDQRTRGLRGGLRNSDRVLITRQLAMLIGSGAPVEEALASVAAQAERPAARRLMSTVRNNVAEGYKFSESLPVKGRAFSPLYRSVVAAGEASGDLGEVLERLAVYLEKSQAIRRKVMTALIYPAVLSVVALAVIILLMVFVVPRVVEQFDTLGQDLPGLTQAVIGLSNFMRGAGVFVGIALIAVGVLARRALRHPRLKRGLDAWLISLPVVGKLVRGISAARFARTFATLLAGRAPVIESLMAARGSVGNLVFAGAIDEMIGKVSEGGSLSSAMRQTEVFPPMLTHLAASGEASGNLPALMEKGADYLDGEFEGASALALGLLEPLIILILGGLVALIVLSIMLPILQLNTLAIG